MVGAAIMITPVCLFSSELVIFELFLQPCCVLTDTCAQVAELESRSIGGPSTAARWRVERSATGQNRVGGLLAHVHRNKSCVTQGLLSTALNADLTGADVSSAAL